MCICPTWDTGAVALLYIEIDIGKDTNLGFAISYGIGGGALFTRVPRVGATLTRDALRRGICGVR